MNPQVLFLLSGVTRYRPLIDMDAQMFLDMLPSLLNFIALAVIMTWLLYKPVKKVLAARADRVESDMNSAAESKKSAAELKAEYEQLKRNIEAERATILDEARKLAGERRDQMLDAAKAEAQDTKDRAGRDIATELEQIKGAVHQSIIDISADMAAKLISATIDKTAHEKLFAEALAELEATTAFNNDAVTV